MEKVEFLSTWTLAWTWIEVKLEVVSVGLSLVHQFDVRIRGRMQAIPLQCLTPCLQSLVLVAHVAVI